MQSEELVLGPLTVHEYLLVIDTESGYVILTTPSSGIAVFGVNLIVYVFSTPGS